MSTVAEKQTYNSNADYNWLEKAITENYIKYYDYAKFTNRKEISSGIYGNTACANWKDSDTVMVLKHSYRLTIKEIVNEVNYYWYEIIINEYTLTFSKNNR